MSDKPEAKPAAKTPKVNWNTDAMSTSYANVVNAISSREEFTLFFGTNQTLDAREGGLDIKLSDRIILNPHAAKRLLTLLTAVMQEYENRFGTVNIDLGSAAPATVAGGSKTN